VSSYVCSLKYLYKVIDLLFYLTDNDENPADAIISKGNASENDIVRIKLGVGGGFMMRITKSENQ